MEEDEDTGGGEEGSDELEKGDCDGMSKLLECKKIGDGKGGKKMCLRYDEKENRSHRSLYLFLRVFSW